MVIICYHLLILPVWHLLGCSCFSDVFITTLKSHMVIICCHLIVLSMWQLLASLCCQTFSSPPVLHWHCWQYKIRLYWSTLDFCWRLLFGAQCNRSYVKASYMLLKSSKLLLEVCWQLLAKQSSLLKREPDLLNDLELMPHNALWWGKCFCFIFCHFACNLSTLFYFIYFFNIIFLYSSTQTQFLVLGPGNDHAWFH